MNRTQTAGEQSPQIHECINTCLDCFHVCWETINTCTGQGLHAHLIKALTTCAELCQTAAKFMALGSPLHPRACELCAEACRQASKECAAGLQGMRHALRGQPDKALW
jgi:hypothetical protein